jgi:hypothetical protein
METNEVIRELILSDEFLTFYNSASSRIKDKYTYALQIMKTQRVVSTKFVKKLQEAEFYEVLVSIGTNEYRTLLIAVDKPSFIEATRAILLNTFLKKDSKQYRREIAKARTILIKEDLI